jgi:ABC-type multidrug transport system fused ATPase/permease subunit
MKEKLKESFGYHKTGLRLLKIVHVMDNSAIPLSIINSILDAVLPYISFILSASIIDQLLNREYKAAFIIAAVLVMTNLALGMINSMLKEVLRFKRIFLFNNLPILMRKKGLELDYETMEKTEVKEKINHTEYTLRLNGGLDEVLDLYGQMLGAVLSVTAAFVMVILLCLSHPKRVTGLISHMGNPVLISMIFVILIVAVVMSSMKVYAKYAAKENEIFEGHGDVEAKLGYLDSKVICNYSSGKVIRLFNMKDMIGENCKEYMAKSRGFFNAMLNVARGQQLSQMWINSVYTVCSYIIVIIKILSGAITIGSLTKYVGALVQFNASISTFITKSAEIRRCCGYMGTLLEFMDLEGSMHKGTIPVEKRLDNEYEIEFHDVSFSYPGNDNKVLDHVSCHITMKDKMAVVGRNGAGKTTFIKLLCRLYEPTEGYITLNGVDIRKYDYDEYLKLFGVVFQDYSLFAFPVGENVASGRNYDDKKVWECLEESGVADRIKKLPEKLNTPLFKYDDNGVEMSGGESQKVAISRALYKDAPFVILDEPTAALDPISEYEIYSKFDEMVKNKTSIYISHRMSSCRFCDDIIVFDNGRIVERGSHEKLIDKDGYYSKLWNAQAQYYTA